jgi:hypothetical protein
MENPIKMDENWGYPYFRQPPYRMLMDAIQSGKPHAINLPFGDGVYHP